jgi:flagellar capping protein FliD
MGYSLKFEHPHFPDEHVFGLNDLGIVKNGGTLEVDEDQERQFVASQGKSIEDAFKSNPLVTLSGSSEISAEEMKQLVPQPAPTEVAVPVEEQKQVITPPVEKNEGVTDNG